MKSSFSVHELEVDEIMNFIDAMFSNLNIGLLIYHLEEHDKPRSLKLVYANEKASEYTRTDMRKLLGKYIIEAFPALEDSDIPETYAEVITSGQARTVGTVEYGDEKIEKGYFGVKAFPMPKDCAGIVFTNMTARKRIDELVKDYSDRLREENAELHSLITEVSEDLKKMWL